MLPCIACYLIVAYYVHFRLMCVLQWRSMTCQYRLSLLMAACSRQTMHRKQLTTAGERFTNIQYDVPCLAALPLTCYRCVQDTGGHKVQGWCSPGEPRPGCLHALRIKRCDHVRHQWVVSDDPRAWRRRSCPRCWRRAPTSRPSPWTGMPAWCVAARYRTAASDMGQR